jgi:hypothetical protein
MAIITFPRDKPDAIKFGEYTFRLARMEELSPLRSGKYIAQNVGAALWMVEASCVTRNETDLGIIRGFFDTLESINTAYFYDPLREYPLAYRRTGFAGLLVSGSPFTGVPTLASVAGNNVEVSLTNLPPNFIFSAGDYIPWDYSGSRALHRVSTGVVANGSGAVTVEVRPQVRPGWSAGATASLYRPAAKMLILPDSFTDQVQGSTRTSRPTFKAVQTL